MSQSERTTVVCTYRLQSGKEGAFMKLLERHWPTLHRLGLVTDERPQVFRGEDEPGKTYLHEIFTWKDAEGPNVAHQSPEVMAIWEPMGELVEERGGRPGMEFPHVERVDVHFVAQ